MVNLIRAGSVACVIGIGLAGCGTVPTLPIQSGTPKTAAQDTRPTVKEIIDHINCELKAGPNEALLKADNFHISVTLLVQVDDQAALTPSLTETDPLPALKGDTRVLTVGGDYDGQRRRTFTTTYVIDTSKWDDAAEVTCAEKAKRYNLQGELGLQEIVSDGLAVKAADPSIIQEPTQADPKSAPSFGSTVQFIVTRSISSLGIGWNLSHWKGPGGSNGLLSGKHLDTDSIIITASPAGAPKGDKKAALDLVAKAQSNAIDKHNQLDAANGAYLSLTTGVHIESNQVTQAKNKVSLAQAKADQADQELKNATAAMAAIDAENANASANATTNSKDMLTTVLLQNLSTGH